MNVEGLRLWSEAEVGFSELRGWNLGVTWIFLTNGVVYYSCSSDQYPVGTISRCSMKEGNWDASESRGSSDLF